MQSFVAYSVHNTCTCVATCTCTSILYLHTLLHVHVRTCMWMYIHVHVGTVYTQMPVYMYMHVHVVNQFPLLSNVQWTLQVSHHPPMFAMHVEHKDWTFWEEYTVASKFRGKYIVIYPIGITHLLIHHTG